MNEVPVDYNDSICSRTRMVKDSWGQGVGVVMTPGWGKCDDSNEWNAKALVMRTMMCGS